MSSKERTAIDTPTWAIAAVCAVFVVAGVAIVFIIDQIEKWFKRARRKAIVHSIDKVKEELLQLGFISLLLVIFQSDLGHICIKDTVLDQWNPCSPKYNRIAYNSSAPGTYPCSKGRSPIASKTTLHQLHIYLFLLAFVHIFFTLITLLSSVMMMRRMKTWEEEARQIHPGEVDQAIRVPVAERNRSFVRHHVANPLNRNTYTVWIVCFFRQFYEGVTKSDYLSLRQGFISTHDLGDRFNFHGYLFRSLEVEFPRLVGISPLLWAYFIFLLAFNVHSIHLYFWITSIPAALVLIVGTKLHHVIATLALDNAGISHHGEYANSPLNPRDELFWFNRPGLIGSTIHYIIFQNSFEITSFLSFVWAFGINSCLLAGKGQKAWLIARVLLSVAIQIMVCFQTLPLYAVVIQMGSHASPALFKKQVRDRLQSWRKDARKRARMRPIYEEGPEIQGESVLGEKFDMEGPNYDDLFTHPRSRSVQDSYKAKLLSKFSLENVNARVGRSASEPIADRVAMMQLPLFRDHPQQPNPDKQDQN